MSGASKHNLPATEPQLKRSLPPSFLAAHAEKRKSSQPHRWSDKDLVTVAKYVSKKPPVKGTTLTVPSYEENQLLRTSAQAYGERAAEERDRTLAEQHIHKLTLAEQLAKLPAPTPAPAAPKPVLIDFKKLSPVTTRSNHPTSRDLRTRTPHLFSLHRAVYNSLIAPQACTFPFVSLSSTLVMDGLTSP
ncbi:hypothetical protein BC835DRAFT_1416105 [Cytidiella melzeri]|nr:hypothetical protein BC835DRAFT_1416105 [Cytidiella melzeri]